MLDKLTDRLIAAFIGLISGLPMALIWSFIALRGIGACTVPDPGLGYVLVCALIKGVYWFLLVGLPLIGLIFGFDGLLKLLSKMWGTDKPKNI